MRAAYGDLALGRKRNLPIRHRLARAARTNGARRHDGRQARALRHAVGFQQIDAERLIPANNLGGGVRGADQAPAQPVDADLAADVAQRQPVGEPEPDGQEHRWLTPRQPHVGATQPDADRPAIGDALQPCRIGHRDRDARMEACPEARHAKLDGGLQFPQILQHRVRLFGVVGDGEAVQRLIQAGDTLGRQAHRQKGEALVTLPLVQQGGSVDDLEQDRAMGQHRALRRAGRAGGVDQHGKIVGRDHGDAGLPGIRTCGMMGSPARQQIGKALAHRVAQVAQRLHVEHHDAAQRRALGADFQRLVELLLVLHEQHRRTAVVQHMRNLIRRAAGENANGHAARAENAEIGIGPFRAGFRQHGGAVPGREPDGGQTQADMARVIRKVRPGDFLPDAAILLSQDHPAGVAVRPLQQQRGQAGDVAGVADRWGRCVRCRRVDVHRHSFFRFQRRRPRTPVSFWPR